MSRRLAATVIRGLLGLVLLGWSAASFAHPHVMIAVEVTFEIRGGALVALRERWTFDEAYRRSSLEQFDRNGNGILDPDELSAFQTLALSTMKRFDNFTAIELAKTKARMRDMEITRLDMAAVRPVIEFRIALVEPLAILSPILIEVYDPTYFSAFSLPSEAALSVDVDPVASCTARLIAPAKNGEQLKAYRAFAATFGPLAARLVTPKTISLVCERR